MHMPYHHNNGFRIPRLLIVTVVAAISITIGAFSGHILGNTQAAGNYATAVQAINQRIESQLNRAANQSLASSRVTAARGQIDSAKTYQTSLAAIVELRSSLDTFNKAAVDECAATSEQLANLDLTTMTKSSRIPGDVREGFANLRETAAEETSCSHIRSLVAYNNFSAFTLDAAINLKQMNTSRFEDETAIRNLQALLKKSPTTPDIQALEKKYGTDFTEYVKTHSELVKSYASVLSAETAGQLTLHSEQIQTNSAKLQSLYDKSAKVYNDASIRESRAALEQAKRLYSEATIINKMPSGPNVNETHLSGMIIINALATYTQETGSYPLSQSLANLLTTLKDKQYISDPTQFQSLGYVRDSSTGAYKLTIPSTDGDIIIMFTDKNAKPDKRTQTFKVQT